MERRAKAQGRKFEAVDGSLTGAEIDFARRAEAEIDDVAGEAGIAGRCMDCRNEFTGLGAAGEVERAAYEVKEISFKVELEVRQPVESQRIRVDGSG